MLRFARPLFLRLLGAPEAGLPPPSALDELLLQGVRRFAGPALAAEAPSALRTHLDTWVDTPEIWPWLQAVSESVAAGVVQRIPTTTAHRALIEARARVVLGPRVSRPFAELCRWADLVHEGGERVRAASTPEARTVSLLAVFEETRADSSLPQASLKLLASALGRSYFEVVTWGLLSRGAEVPQEIAEVVAGRYASSLVLGLHTLSKDPRSGVRRDDLPKPGHHLF